MYIESDGNISKVKIFDLIKRSVDNKNLKKVLILPPDYTRKYSYAGEITAMYYDVLKDTCQVDIMPALGTHEPMTREQAEAFFGEKIPYDKLIVHNWKTDVKKNVIVIDVVDEYGAMVKACNMHSIFANPYYVPFGDITKTDYEPGDMVIIDGIEERIERITEVDINSFEDKYGSYLSQEQVAREYFVSTGTVTSWIKKRKITPTVEYKFGSKSLYLFSPDDVEKYRKELDIKEHNDNTIKDDFFDFLEERDYSLSYKMPFMLAVVKHIDSIGDAKIDDVLDDYIAFYQDRINRGLQVDRSTCPYNEEMLKDRKAICRNMLTNPFEKFERKRFLYYSKDLSVISMNHALYSQMESEDWDRVRRQLQEDLKNYYSEMGGV